MKEFLAKAVETGIVIESGEGAFKTFRLPSGEKDGGFRPPIALSETAPITVQDIPLRALEMIPSLPFVLFAPWALCPKEDKFPAKAFVQSSGKWAVLMFHTLTTAQRAVAEKPWLRSGTLVDWRRAADHVKNPAPAEAQSVMQITSCSLCKSECRKSVMRAFNGEELYCRSCCMAIESRSDSEKVKATECVKAMLDMMAENDDIFIAENILRKQLSLRWPSACKSRQEAALWIQDAVDSGEAIRFKRPGMKAKLICRAHLYEMAISPFPLSDTDTSAEEQHVIDMLWDRNGWMKRTEAIASLKENFKTMQSPFLRNKCILNAAESKKFFVAKGSWGQTLGLTIEDAHTALDIVRPSLEGAAENSVSSAKAMTQDYAEEDSTEIDIAGRTSPISKESVSTQESEIANETDS